jgi:hypothetical protein
MARTLLTGSVQGVITSAVFNDGIAFGPGNIFERQTGGQTILYAGYGSVAGDGLSRSGTVISSFSASSVNDPLLNIGNCRSIHNRLAGLESEGQRPVDGGKYGSHVYDPTSKAPTVLASRAHSNFRRR